MSPKILARFTIAGYTWQVGFPFGIRLFSRTVQTFRVPGFAFSKRGTMSGFNIFGFTFIISKRKVTYVGYFRKAK